MDITFTKGEDVSGLELFESYFRGHAMSKVVTALRDGVKLVKLFGGSRKKENFPVAYKSSLKYLDIHSINSNPFIDPT